MCRSHQYIQVRSDTVTAIALVLAAMFTDKAVVLIDLEGEEVLSIAEQPITEVLLHFSLLESPI